MDVLRQRNYVMSLENIAGPRVSPNSPLSVHIQYNQSLIRELADEFNTNRTNIEMVSHMYLQGYFFADSAMGRLTQLLSDSLGPCRGL